jgi:UPF0755 protein
VAEHSRRRGRGRRNSLLPPAYGAPSGEPDPDLRPAPVGDDDLRPAPVGDDDLRPAPVGDDDQRPAPVGDHGRRAAPVGDHDLRAAPVSYQQADQPQAAAPIERDAAYDPAVNRQQDRLAPPSRGTYISYVDEGELDADGSAILTAVFVDEQGYAADGTYIGSAVYVDEDGHADDGTYVSLVDAAPEDAPSGPPADGHRRGLGAALPPDDGRRRRRWHRHPILGTFVIVVVVLVLIVGGGIVWAAHEANPGGKSGHDVTVRIATGENTEAIGKQLAKAGVIHGDGTLFRYYVKVEGDGPLYPGTYHLPTNESYDHVISTLSSPPVPSVDTLAIPEGFTLTEIAARVAAMPGMHFTASSFLALSKSGSVTSPYEPSGKHDLEGLLFPATYKFQQGTSESAVMSTLEGDFVTEANNLGLKAAAAKLGMTPYDVIKVASIIQGEAKYANDGPRVASVIYNRLKAGWTLGDDSTLVYALRKANPNININKINYNQPNPYNTRLNKGLPPTPIDMPSKTFLEAAMHPAKTTYMYFLEVNQDGQLGFATTAQGDAQLIDTCKAHGLC